MYNHKDGISLRKVASHDLRTLLELKAESWWGTHTTPILNIDDQEKWFHGLSHRELFLMAEMEDPDNKFCPQRGVACYTNIDPIARTLDISGSILKKHRKPEIVKPAFAAGLDFAFEILNATRVNAEVLSCNAPAQKLEIGYLGFEIEGRKRKAVYKSGRYYDSLILGLLREDWEKQERVKNYNGSCNLNFDHDKAEELSQRSIRQY
jgi:RimJ/RimL family protein N-acetyltransferase